MRAPNDPYPDSLDRIIRSRIRGEEEAALAAVTEICFVPPKLMKKRWPAKSVIAKIYTRDHYHCRYCGERVILTAVMHLVSRLYPEQFPFHKNWKTDSTHPAFISRSATLDHVEPIAGGGDPVDPDNLVTACWNCNRRKGDLRINQLDWSLIEPRDKDWKGLTELFHPLWEAAGRPPLTVNDSGWMRAIRKAEISYH